MGKANTSVYEYECNGCGHRFKVETTFKEPACPPPPDADAGGYPEEQPACPTCHSHDTEKVTVRPVEERE